MTDTEALTRTVDPARLASGQWCHRTEKTLGQGDINASYSADRIAMGQPVKTFAWEGGLWVCVGTHYRGNDAVSAEGYRLVHLSQCDGKPVTYAEKTQDGDAARSDPNGFYHGMTVRHGGQELVLCGPPVTFAAGQTAQLSLF